MTQKEVEVRFVQYNVAGNCGDRLTSGNWMFRKDVLFYQKAPYKRFVRDRLGLPVMFRKRPEGDLSVSTVPQQAKLGGMDYQIWGVPTIGVWSRFEGDMLTVDELHERMQFLFFAQLRTHLEEIVKPLSGKDLVKAGMMKTVDSMYLRQRNYAKAFGLKWPELPTMYRDEIAEAIDAKIKRYHDPKAAAQRERAHARKIAKQAFGL